MFAGLTRGSSPVHPAALLILLPVADLVSGGAQALPVGAGAIQRIRVRSIEHDDGTQQSAHATNQRSIDVEPNIGGIRVVVARRQPDGLKIGKSVGFSAMGQEAILICRPQQAGEGLGTFLRSGLHHNAPSPLQTGLKHPREYALERLPLQVIEQDLGHGTIQQVRQVRSRGGRFRALASEFIAARVNHHWGIAQMKLKLLSALVLLVAGIAPAQSANLCNCCGEADTVESCTVACVPLKPAAGQCVATVDFAGSAEIGEGINPLYDVPLQNVWLGSARRDQLEIFRRLLETARKGAESDRRTALTAYSRSKIDKVEADRRASRYDDAMINYYLGTKAYRDTFETAN